MAGACAGRVYIWGTARHIDCRKASLELSRLFMDTQEGSIREKDQTRMLAILKQCL